MNIDYMKRLFYCYSPVLYRALVSNGFKCLGYGKNIDTDSKFSIFEGTDTFNYFKNEVYPLIRKDFE